MRVVLVVLVVMLSGCALEGAQCSGRIAECRSSQEVVWCDQGVFTAFSCPGAKGCSSNANGRVLCDFRGSPEGALCPFDANGSGYCSSGTRFIVCKASVWTGQPCSSCDQNGDLATCRP